MKFLKSILRTKALVPTFIILILLTLYFRFFFDLNLKWTSEYFLSRVHGAEVNISKITTNFLTPSMSIHGIQFTNKSNLHENLLEIGNIKLKLLFDSILRGKVVIENAEVNKIKLFSPRKRKGFLIKKSDSTTRNIKKLEETTLNKSKEQFNDNILGDIASVLSGTDKDIQLKEIEEDLKTNLRIRKLEEEFKNKETEWKKRIAELPTEETLNSIKTQFKQINFKSKNILERLKSIAKAKSLLDKVQKQYKITDKTLKDFKKDFNYFENQFNQLDDYVKQDIQDIQSRFKIPNINTANLSKDIFGTFLSEKLAPYQKYIQLLKQYMPPVKQNTPSKTQKMAKLDDFSGVNYNFPITVSYPTFWLKNAKVSSKATDKGFSGNLTGQIKNVTSNPVHIGQPTSINIKGDFPDQNIKGIHINAIIDQTKNTLRQDIKGTIKSFDIGQMKLADSQKLKFYLQNSIGQLNFKINGQADQLKITINQLLKNTEYLVQANDKKVETIFNSAIQRMPSISIDAHATGEINKLNWSIISNFGHELRKSIEVEVQQKIKQTKAKIKKQVEAQVLQKKNELKQDFNQYKNELNQRVEAAQKEYDDLKRKLKL